MVWKVRCSMRRRGGLWFLSILVIWKCWRLSRLPICGLLRYTTFDGSSMVPLLVAVVDSEMELQKNRAISYAERDQEGTKLKLQDLAMAIAVASRSFVGSTKSQMTTFLQPGTALLFSVSKQRVLLGSDQGLSLWICLWLEADWEGKFITRI